MLLIVFVEVILTISHCLVPSVTVDALQVNDYMNIYHNKK